jgi:hypothetical protein
MSQLSQGFAAAVIDSFFTVVLADTSPELLGKDQGSRSAIETVETAGLAFDLFGRSAVIAVEPSAANGVEWNDFPVDVPKPPNMSFSATAGTHDAL